MQTETFFYDTGSNINVTDRGQELGYTMAHSLATVATHNGDDRYEPALFMPSALVLFTQYIQCVLNHTQWWGRHR